MKRFFKIVVFLALAIFFFTKIKMNTNQSDFLDSYLHELESYIEQRDAINIEVSQADVAWHLDHMLKTINQIYLALEESNPDEFDSSFSMIRTASLSLNYIPRGRAQSPQSVRPPENILTEDIFSQLEEVRRNVKKFPELYKGAYFDHPVFGHLKRSHSMRFLQVHTNHHLKIIKDILETP
ncbi:MAG: DUF1569 domain-containing protein [Bacteroidia bacterium]|nr:DUF1569 domain-containing protein [Bacteroidia bacterium]MBT8270047.1 DUF1569 domain-containing protein [Bacteroidia bacterium]NNF83027.1 DUF1569 domain-containing protein [Flavobacteriaceae bacterium]NNK70780.1 DUF1569 domain-containing protein [Flavobacteriaceae bacterium]NNL79361.1 DUF1569 domain-containing protein [Flavobacteriaceae bacterium]